MAEDRYGSGGATRLRNILIDAYKESGYDKYTAEMEALRIIPEGDWPSRIKTDADVWRNNGAASYESISKSGDDSHNVLEVIYHAGSKPDVDRGIHLSMDELKKQFPKLYNVIYGDR